jgi:hypothetical protein
MAPGERRCWLCGWKPPAGPAGSASSAEAAAAAMAAAVAGGARFRPARPPRPAFHFGLSTLLLLVALGGGLFGLIAVAPGLGIPVAVFSLPALVRTCITAYRRELRGEPMSPEAKVGTFALTLLLSVVISVVTLVVFFITFLLSCMMAGGRFMSPDQDERPGTIAMFVALPAAGAVLVGSLLLWYRLAHRGRNRKSGPIGP